MTEQEWREVGTLAKKIRDDLLKLHALTTGKMPKTIVRHITNSVSDLDRFRVNADGRLARVNHDLYIEEDIFYGQPDDVRVCELQRIDKMQ